MLAGIALALALGTVSAARAQDYPNRALQMIVTVKPA
jgi:hypothetical protein